MGMLSRLPKVNPNSGALSPLVLALDGALERSIQNEDGAVKHVLGFPETVILNLGLEERCLREQLQGTLRFRRQVVAHARGLMKSIRPEVGSHSLRPAMCRMQRMVRADLVKSRIRFSTLPF